MHRVTHKSSQTSCEFIQVSEENRRLTYSASPKRQASFPLVRRAASLAGPAMPCASLFDPLCQNGHLVLITAIQNSNIQAIQDLTPTYRSLVEHHRSNKMGVAFNEKYSNLKQLHMDRLICSQTAEEYCNVLHRAMVVASLENNVEDNPCILTCVLEIYYILGQDVLEFALTPMQESGFKCATSVTPSLARFVIDHSLNLKNANLAYAICPDYKQTDPFKKEAADAKRNLYRYIKNYTPEHTQPLKSAKKVG